MIADNMVRRWVDAATLILGVWLALSPTTLNYMDQNTPDLNATFAGVVIAVTATASLLNFHRWKEWLNAALGAWLVVSPFLLGYPAPDIARNNQMAVGMLVATLALWSALVRYTGVDAAVPDGASEAMGSTRPKPAECRTFPRFSSIRWIVLSAEGRIVVAIVAILVLTALGVVGSIDHA